MKLPFESSCLCVSGDRKPKMHFDDMPEFVVLLESMGFERFGPAHSMHNGFELRHKYRRIAFYDNREYGNKEIEFRVIDYEPYRVYEKFIFGLFKTKSFGARWNLLNMFFERNHRFIKKEINLLIQISKAIK